MTSNLSHLQEIFFCAKINIEIEDITGVKLMDFNVNKAMIMAAGVGSRLDPLTKNLPKPLVTIANKPVMDILLENLASINVKNVISNTHYLAEQIIKRYEDNAFGINFNHIKEETLSGTAGGLKKCQHFFSEGEVFLVLSADGLSNADLLKGVAVHKSSNAIATIGIKSVPQEEVSHFGVVVTDTDGYITEFQEKPSIEDAKSNFINTGIYIFKYDIFDYIPENTFYDFAKNVFPKLLKEHAINTFEIKEYWSDIGTLDQYQQSVQDLFGGELHFKHSDIVKTETGAYITESGEMPGCARFVGNSTIGCNCRIGKNVTITNSILWDDVVLGDGVCITDSIVASGCEIKTNLTSAIVGMGQIIVEEPLKIQA